METKDEHRAHNNRVDEAGFHLPVVYRAMEVLPSDGNWTLIAYLTCTGRLRRMQFPLQALSLYHTSLTCPPVAHPLQIAVEADREECS